MWDTIYCTHIIWGSPQKATILASPQTQSQSIVFLHIYVGMTYAPKLDWSISDRYAKLSQDGYYQAEYVWIGGNGLDIRCKTRTLREKPSKLSDFPVWNFDGMFYP